MNENNQPKSQLTAQLIHQLQSIVGETNLITEPNKTLAYRQGFRFGEGEALAVVTPTTLIEQWQVLQACVSADVIVITQAANTGLTGGSTPFGDDYDRPIVIVNTQKCGTGNGSSLENNIQIIKNGTQVVCLPNSTLNALEQRLISYDREPHSVIGSSCIGASVLGGVCNNSGGALVQRGPAYTEMSVFAQLDNDGNLQLINHLGIELGDTAEQILTNLQTANYTPEQVEKEAGAGHDHSYCDHVRKIDETSPARFNADPSRLYEASGSAGKLMVFAVRLDTFPLEKSTQIYYVGTNDTKELDGIRRHILAKFDNLPISGEYIHHEAFDVAEKYGKDTFWFIQKFGTDRLPTLSSLKTKVDRLCNRLPFLPSHFSDRFMQVFSKFLPQHLPASMREYRDKYEHHLILKMGGAGVAEADDYLKAYFDNNTGDYFRCNAVESQSAMLHRFAVAGAAVRYRSIHSDTVEDIVALDIALRRNDNEWFETLPDEIEDAFIHKLYYGHFFCHVFHQDYIAKKGVDCHAIEEDMLALLEERGAQYPAEHNVGHLYHAKPELKNFYQTLDPTNSFNAGIGKTSKQKYWK